MALLDAHKNAFRSSDEIMGHLEFVLFYRIDISKKLSDKLEEKLSTCTAISLISSSFYSTQCSLLNQLRGRRYTRVKLCLARFGTIITKFFKMTKHAEDMKKHQKTLYEGAMFLGRVYTWSRRSSNVFFELFTSVECFIEYLDEMDHLVDEFNEGILLIIEEIDSEVASLQNELENYDVVGTYVFWTIFTCLCFGVVASLFYVFLRRY